MKIEIGIKAVSRLLALMLVLIGCSHYPKVKTFPVSANPTQEIFLLNRDMLIVKNAQADVLSPKNFERAKEHQKEANESLKANERASLTLKHVALSRHYLDQARLYSGRSNVHLKGVSEARTRALEAGARNYYNYEFTKADRKLKDLTARIEKDENFETGKEGRQAHETYLAIELMSLKKNNHTKPQDLALQQGQQEYESRFQRAKNRFNPKEASVYKKGDALLIRLHGLRFTSAKSDLSSGNLALLNKVNLAIEDLDAKKVQVNGHTDSVGGKSANQKVSAQRADVIKNYLQEKNDNDGLMIETRGFDYQEPIATNRTAKGRAMNRRVDILIEPAESSQE